MGADPANCCFLAFLIPIGLLVGVIILRCGIHFADTALRKHLAQGGDSERSFPRNGGAALPHPTLGRSAGIVLARALITLVVNIPIHIVTRIGAASVSGGRAESIPEQVASLTHFPITFLINAGVLASMLPTGLRRACLVVLFEYFVVIAIGIILALPLVVLSIALADR
jgi:hypothetical protein